MAKIGKIIKQNIPAGRTINLVRKNRIVRNVMLVLVLIFCMTVIVPFVLIADIFTGSLRNSLVEVNELDGIDIDKFVESVDSGRYICISENLVLDTQTQDVYDIYKLSDELNLDYEITCQHSIGNSIDNISQLMLEERVNPDEDEE
jgi:hypothetical protein